MKQILIIVDIDLATDGVFLCVKGKTKMINGGLERQVIPMLLRGFSYGEIIGEGFNTRNRFKSVIGHAEIDAIEMACKHLGDWRLDDCIMYVTLLPCMMCTGAIVESRIKEVYYLCDRTNVCFDGAKRLNTIKLSNDREVDEYTKLLQLFFENKRNKL